MPGPTSSSVLSNAQLAQGNNQLLSQLPYPSSTSDLSPISTYRPDASVSDPFTRAITAAIQANSGKTSGESIGLRISLVSKVADRTSPYYNMSYRQLYDVTAFQGVTVTSEAILDVAMRLITTSYFCKSLIADTLFGDPQSTRNHLKNLFQFGHQKGCSSTIFLKQETESTNNVSHLVTGQARGLRVIGFLLGTEVYQLLEFDTLTQLSTSVTSATILPEALTQYFDRILVQLFSSGESQAIRAHAQAQEDLTVWIRKFQFLPTDLVSLQSLSLEIIMRSQQASMLSLPTAAGSSGTSQHGGHDRGIKPPKSRGSGKGGKGTGNSPNNFKSLQNFCSVWLRTANLPCGSGACKPGSKFKLKHATEFAALPKTDRENIVAAALKLYPNDVKVSP